MILIDTSVWIELFQRKKAKLETSLLYKMAICPPVMQEVLQGIKDKTEFAEFRVLFSAFPVIGSPVKLSTYEHAAHLFRLGRSKGYTVRSSVDCLIAAIAIENKLPVWHEDRDFKHLEKFSDLEIFKI